MGILQEYGQGQTIFQESGQGKALLQEQGYGQTILLEQGQRQGIGTPGIRIWKALIQEQRYRERLHKEKLYGKTTYIPGIGIEKGDKGEKGHSPGIVKGKARNSYKQGRKYGHIQQKEKGRHLYVLCSQIGNYGKLNFLCCFTNSITFC